MNTRIIYALALTLTSCWAHAVEGDPQPSVMWEYFHQRLLDNADFVFDEAVKVSVPPFAEDARQVPIEVDARALPGKVERVMIWAELNPIPQVLTLYPSAELEKFLAVRIRVEQATPIRAALLMDDGIWHVGSARVEAAGGGCSAPSVVRAQEGWEDHLGEIFGARFKAGDNSRLRLSVSHPMDNGLVDSIPEFYVNQAELRDRSGAVLARIDLFSAVSENPTLTLGIKGHPETQLWLRDNNGNEFTADIP
ncbi:quinoprotein dehydrogenase-associated SoxYZ-like carrier [Denitrificimonas caeni]|uniref:quinoprotein dehydrogenase-associated SoxYZ-like carrier n=1 Tax=Denitrificimonas caeni TaxID=521720 RepID=UPI00196289D2|nr:quinoprotein dehydrogenase-associated SoxYZ-like carrier [Denitrificimonas caeni]